MNRRRLLRGGAATGGLLALGVGGGALAWGHMGSIDHYNERVRAMRSALAQSPDLPELVRYATLAASGHNAQPWRFRAEANRIEILPDLGRLTPVVDPDGHHLFVSLGCAVENLALAAEARGRRGTVTFDASGEGSLTFDVGRGWGDTSSLFDAIPARRSARTDYDASAPSASSVASLASQCAVPGVDVVMITERERISQVRDLVVAANDAQFGDPSFVSELASWLRYNATEAVRRGDGLFTAATGNPMLPTWLGPFAFHRFTTVEAENEKCARQVASSSGLAVFVARADDREHWALAGRSCQRFALAATALGLRYSFVNQPVEVPAARPELARLVGAVGSRPNAMIRFGHGPGLPFSARRPVARVWA